MLACIGAEPGVECGSETCHGAGAVTDCAFDPLAGGCHAHTQLRNEEQRIVTKAVLTLRA